MCLARALSMIFGLSLLIRKPLRKRRGDEIYWWEKGEW